MTAQTTDLTRLSADAMARGLAAGDFTSEQLVQANGAGMIALGSAMALGFKPRLSALALLPMLAATTVSAHNFWDIEDPQAKNQQMTAFFGNLAAAGGLVTVATTKN